MKNQYYLRVKSSLLNIPMKPVVHFSLAVLMSVFLISCNYQGKSSPLGTTSATTIPTPMLGKASVFGKVISKNSALPISGIDVWLAKVIRQENEAIYVLDTINSPSILTDENGAFLIRDVDPGEYVIVIGNPEILYEIISEDSGKAKVWQFNVGKITEVGELLVSNFK